MWLKKANSLGSEDGLYKLNILLEFGFKCKSVFQEEIMVISGVWYFGLFDN